MRKVNRSATQIFPVFRELFARDQQPASSVSRPL